MLSYCSAILQNSLSSAREHVPTRCSGVFQSMHHEWCTCWIDYFWSFEYPLIFFISINCILMASGPSWSCTRQRLLGFAARLPRDHSYQDSLKWAFAAGQCTDRSRNIDLSFKIASAAALQDMRRCEKRYRSLAVSICWSDWKITWWWPFLHIILVYLSYS